MSADDRPVRPSSGGPLRLTGLVAELRRRRVFRVAAAYTAGGLAVIYAADVILPRLAAPDWTVTLVIVLTGLGLVVAVGLAWVFDATPDGVVRTAPAATAAEEPPAADRRAIAVLPFENMSAADNDFFSDGIAEEIINALAQLPELRVAGRTSAFSFKGQHEDLRSIGRKLNVGTVLEGSVRRAGNRVRITAQLIDTSDGYHRWSERYDRDLDDIFAVQDEIARAIATRLAGTLGDRTPGSLVGRHTASREAYDLYLEGRHHAATLMEPGFGLAIDAYERALALDPQFALAWVALAECLMGRAIIQDLPYTSAAQRARAAAGTALDLDETLPEAHSIMGVIHTYFDLDWRRAEEEFRRALELGPGSATAHTWYGDLLAFTRRYEEAVEEARRALDIEPLSPIVRWNFVQNLFVAGRLQETEREIESGLRLFPGAYFLLFFRGLIAWTRGHGAQAIAALDAATSAAGDDPGFLPFFLTAACYRFGEFSRGDELFRRVRERADREHVSAAWFALIDLCRGNEPEAIRWLRAGRQNRDGWFASFRVTTEALRIPTSPEFIEEMERLGLP